jgi:hypothetical protein
VKPVVLVYAETSYPGWKVTVDAVDKPLLSVPYKLLGVALDPGTHDVRFSFGLDGWGVFVGLMTVAALSQFLFILSPKN